MQNNYVLIEQAINKAVSKGVYNLAEVQAIIQALGALQEHLGLIPQNAKADGQPAN